jgi:hypothetical protein
MNVLQQNMHKLNFTVKSANNNLENHTEDYTGISMNENICVQTKRVDKSTGYNLHEKHRA